MLYSRQWAYSVLWFSLVHLQSALYIAFLVSYKQGNSLHYCISNHCHIDHYFICNKNTNKLGKCISYMLISTVLKSKSLVSLGPEKVADPPRGDICVRFDGLSRVYLPAQSPLFFQVLFHLFKNRIFKVSH